MHEIVKYRGELMGAAILLVLIHHFYNATRFSMLPYIPPLGYFAVDIFLFLSGFGLCFGYGKYKSIFAFYKRRMSRIYPTYLTVIIIAAATTASLSVVEILLLSTTVTAYIPYHGRGPFDWFVPAIVLFYLLFPLIFYFAGKGRKWIVAVIICSFIPPAIYIAGYLQYSLSPFMVARIPIFTLGVIAGVLYIKKVPVGRNIIVVSEAVAIIGLIVMILIQNLDEQAFIRHLIFLLPFAVIAPGLCFLGCRLMRHLPGGVCAILSFIGGISLEVYLIHIVFLMPYCDFVKERFFSSYLLSWLAGLLFVVSAIIAGYLVSVFVKFITNSSGLLISRLRGRRHSQ